MFRLLEKRQLIEKEIFMKKTYRSIILLPALAMSASMLSGCGGTQKNNFAYDLDFNVDVSRFTITHRGTLPE